jgi:hypothetical protein
MPAAVARRGGRWRALRLELGGARQERPHLSGEHLRIAAAHRLHGFLAALAELAEQTALGRGLGGPRRRQQWNGVRLQVLGGAEPSQVRDQLVFVARRHQRRQQDHIRYLLIDRRDRGIARLDEDQLAWTISRTMRLRMPPWRMSGSIARTSAIYGCLLVNSKYQLATSKARPNPNAQTTHTVWSLIGRWELGAPWSLDLAVGTLSRSY